MPQTNKETQLTISVPDSLTASERETAASEIIEFIRARSKEGYNKYNRRWAGKAGEYTKGYAKKKGKSSPVDLDLSSEMLESMQYFSSKSKKGEIVIGFKKGTKVERKAEGNIIGSYGRDPNPKKARPFLDILKRDVNLIINALELGS